MTKHNERYLYIKLFIQGHIKLYIFNIYLHANMSEKQNRITLQNELITLIKNSIISKFHVIIIGDFNTNINRYYDKVQLCSKLN